MSSHAIVIGIDHYPRPEWNLTGAVRDAVTFARWCVTAGGVDPKDLTLLLSTDPSGTPLSELLKARAGAPDLSSQVKDANEVNIRNTLLDYRAGAGKNADRLWFYYAGHGLAPPAASPEAGPIVVPADVNNLERYVSDNPISLEIFRSAMADVNPPKEQFFFVDACRDVLEVSGNKSLTQQFVWDVRKIKDEQLATQCVLFATTAGNKAREIRGNGLFSRALMAALRGLGPELRNSRPNELPRKRLFFDDVVTFVTEAVKRDLSKIPDTDPSDVKAIVPYGGIYRVKGGVVVTEFNPHQLPTAKVSAILAPGDALNSARIEFLYHNDALDTWDVRPANPAPAGPPVLEETIFEVPGGLHFLQITANGYEKQTPDILIYEDKRFTIDLKPSQPPKVIEESVTRAGGGLGNALATATIIVTCADRLSRVAVVDGRGKEWGRNFERVYVSELPPGPYYVSAETTASNRVQQIVYAEAGMTYDIPLDVAAMPVGPTLTESLKGTDISLGDTYSHPSENFGDVANMRLGSILAYAAWAARWPESEGFHRLRGIGVDKLPSLSVDQSALQILVGDVADPEASFARDCRVQVESSGAALVPGNVIVLGDNRPGTESLSLEPLPKFPAARQASIRSAPGSLRLRVEMPGFEPASFALTLLPGFVTVLVISREEKSDIDVQQYFNPIDPMRSVHPPEFEPPRKDDVRLVELGWRALQERESLDAVEYRGLLEGKRSNPLLAIIAGYRMFGTEREEKFRVLPSQPPPGVVTSSALWNMVYLFPGLPDVHVLAGMYDPDRRDEHFQRAMDTGTPVMVEGFWTLCEWLAKKAIDERKPPPTLRQSVLPGMVWTSFTEADRAQRIESVHVITPTGRTYADAPDRIAEVARSVGRLEATGGPDGAFLCTALLIAPQLVLCPLHFAVKFAEQQADGSWTMQGDARVRFDLTDAASERAVVRVLRSLRPPEFLDTDGGALSRAGLDQSWPVVLELSEPAAVVPLVVAPAAPEAGQRVAVIGFPRSDARISSEMFAEHFTGSAGEKHVMPGAVLRSPGKTWTLEYDCFTADGTSGGPVVNLQTGAVLGMHVAASAVLDGRKRGIAIALTSYSEDQLTSLSTTESERSISAAGGME